MTVGFIIGIGSTVIAVIWILIRTLIVEPLRSWWMYHDRGRRRHDR